MDSISASDTAVSSIAQQQQDTQLVATNSLTLTEFHRFPNLPPELRNSIWEYVCRQPRIVEVRVEILTPGLCVDDIDDMADNTDVPFPYKFYSRNGLPSILHVSREARDVGLKHYYPAFSTKCIVNSENKYVDSPFSAYMNWKVDILCPVLPRIIPEPFTAHTTSCITWIEICTLTSVRHLAIDRNARRHEDCLSLMLGLNETESLIFYHDDDAKPVIHGNSTATNARPYDPSRAVCIGRKNGVIFHKLVDMFDGISDWKNLFCAVSSFNDALAIASYIESDDTAKLWPQTDEYWPQECATAGIGKWKKPEIKLMLMSKKVTEKDLDTGDDEDD